MNKLNDPVPRVVSHVLSAIGNFFEGSDVFVIKKYANVLLTQIM